VSNNNKPGKKKILIVSRMFHPVNSPRAFRTTELVKEFAREGHDVTLYTVKNDEHHVPFEQEYGVAIKDLGEPVIRDFNTSGGRVKNITARAVNRGLSLLFEYPNIELMWRVKRALKSEKGYDLLISIAVSYPIHWGVAAARRPDHPIANTWVADCGDPYMGQETDSFNKLFYFKYVEKWFCRKADYLSIPIEDAKTAYYSECRDKIEVIPQGFNFEESAPDTTLYEPNSVPTFAYAGGLMPGSRDPRSFLERLVSLDNEYRFILYTRSRHLVEPYLDRANGRIEIRDYIPRKKLLKKLSRMDFLVNFENSTSVQLPSKLIDYHLAGRPVLSVDGLKPDMDNLVQFLNGNYTGRYPYNGVDRYRIENVCAKFLGLCGG
jgi:hypothetical protein